MQRTRIKEALAAAEPMDRIKVAGWVRTRRDAKDVSFVEVNDGSCLANIQVVVERDTVVFEAVKEAHVGASLLVEGALVPSLGKEQRYEIKAESATVVGSADPERYPLQKKRHSDEFLREIAHLRPRTNKFGALFRIRSEASFAVHAFFRERGFHLAHTPIITGSDCEGAGELFRVSTLPLGSKPQEQMAPGESPFARDFFGKEASLTVSGQLEAEALALALGRVYTFGPTFRAENSNTARHAAEFWMVEPEMAFAELADNMELAESFTRQTLARLRETCAEDLELFARFVDKELPARLATIIDRPFERIAYDEAVDILRAAMGKGKKFEFEPAWGADLQTEHERFLCEEHVAGPVIVYNYPKAIKPFYMRQNEDGRTVAAMDVLVPGIGELIGGSQREERLDMLEARITELGLPLANYWWYLDLRRFGSVPHVGYGMGFERFLMLFTGVANIRDVIPFPRTPRNLEF